MHSFSMVNIYLKSALFVDCNMSFFITEKEFFELFSSQRRSFFITGKEEAFSVSAMDAAGSKEALVGFIPW